MAVFDSSSSPSSSTDSATLQLNKAPPPTKPIATKTPSKPGMDKAPLGKKRSNLPDRNGESSSSINSTEYSLEHSPEDSDTMIARALGAEEYVGVNCGIFA